MADQSTDADLLTPAVRRYLGDAAVRSAVAYLLAVKQHAVPPDLTLSELHGYFAARAEAEAIRSEWAICLLAFWQKIWGERLDGWKPASLGEAAAAEQSVTPKACWDNDDFSIWHTKNDYVLYTAFQMTAGSCSIAVSLEVNDKPALKDLAGFAWRKDDDWDQWLVHSLPRDPAALDFDLADLEKDAAEALRTVEALVGGSN